MKNWNQPQKVSDIDVAFPASVKNMMPEMKDIPEEFQSFSGPYQDLVSEWFFKGLKKSKLKPKEGVDEGDAFRHLGCIIGSFEPKHEHKTAGAAYLMSKWFDIA